MGLISGFKNRFVLEQALQFGKEFYQLDLGESVAPMRQTVLNQIERLGRPIPQVVFFMLVPAFLEYLDDLKRLELYDGAMSLRLQGAMPEDVFDNFMLFYEQASDSP